MSAPSVTPELKALLRQVKLGRCLDTLPERLALASTGGMGHAEFLELVLADEVMRRETTSADRRARAAGLDPEMTLDRWDDTAKITYDRATWNELVSLRFVEGFRNLPWTLAFLVSVAISMALLELASRSIPMGTAYAVWGGIGAVGTVVVGILFFHEPSSTVRVLLILAIVAAIAGLRLTA